MKLRLCIFLLILLSSCGKSPKNFKLNKQEPVKIVLNNTSVNSKCDFETYVEYKDSLPLYIIPNGNVVKYYRFEDNPDYDFGGGFLFKNSELGWLQIGKDKFNPDLEGYWIESQFIKVGTTNYANQRISLFEKPDKNSKVTGYLHEESYLNVMSCDSNWVYVIKGVVRGWLSPEFICNNSETNCN